MRTGSPDQETTLIPPSVGDYNIIDLIASGGMGDVFLARDKTGSEVALKCFRQSSGVLPDQLDERFERERILSAQIAHPNIVTLLDHGEEDGRQFLVMEYVVGSNLRQIIDDGGELGLDAVDEIIQSIGAAVGYLHQKGIVHRDLKPDNILIDADDTVKVTDFGIAAKIEDMGSMTTTGQVFGSADYIAPEQRHELPVDERADQYSLAVIAYELLTGEKPLGIFKPPSALNQQLDARVDRVIMRGLQKDRDDRFDTVEQFCEDLGNAIRCVRPPGIRFSTAAVLMTSAIGICLVVTIVIRAQSNPDASVAARLTDQSITPVPMNAID